MIKVTVSPINARYPTLSFDVNLESSEGGMFTFRKIYEMYAREARLEQNTMTFLFVDEKLVNYGTPILYFVNEEQVICKADIIAC